MSLFSRIRALLAVLTLILSGAVVVLTTSVSASADPLCFQTPGFAAARHANRVQARVPDDAFTLRPDSYTTASNSMLTVPDPGVLTNDSLPEFWEVFEADGGAPSHGSLYFPFGEDGENGGGFYYCPDTGFVGVDHFTYEVCNFDDDVAVRRDVDDDPCQTAQVTISVGLGGGCISGFPDVSSANPFCPDVAYLTTYHFASGYSDGNFHPTAPVTRQAVAAVLQRFADAGAPSSCGHAPFPDVPVSSPFCAAIAYLVAHQVIAGYADGNFHPAAAVSREAIASFLYKLQNPGKTPPACTKAPFSDVPVTSPFCGAITWLVSNGIANGNADGSFHPTQAVSRQALARFVHRLGSLGD